MRHFFAPLVGLGRICPTPAYLSSIVMIGPGFYVGWQGWTSVPTAL